MNPKVHFFDTEGEAYDASQYREYIKDGDVLLIPGVCAAVLYNHAWPVIAAGEDRKDGECFHDIVPGKRWEDLEHGLHYLPSVHLARYVHLYLLAKMKEDPERWTLF